MGLPGEPRAQAERTSSPIPLQTSVRIKEFIRGSVSGYRLRDKVFRGGALLGSGSLAEQTARFTRNMVLTRLLAPGAFGTMAIVLSSSSLVESLTDVGVRQAIIQNPRGREQAYLNAGWWMGMGRSMCLYAIVFALAPWISRFYGNAELSALLRVALLGNLLNGALSPRSTLAQKEMNLGRWAAITNGGGMCGVVLTVILSFVLRDVWALAIGYCGENAFRCLLSYILCPGLPTLKFNWHAGRDLVKFSRGVFGLSFFNLIFIRTDIFVLGKLYSSAALGLYTMAVYLVQTPSFFLINLLNQALLPALSQVQADKERMNHILAEVTSWLILLGLPVVVVGWLCASSLLTVVYGARYAAAAGSLAVAGGVAFLNVLNNQITTGFYAMGRPGLHRRAVAASAATMLIAIYPACKLLGVVGGQVAALLAIAISYFLQVTRIRGLTGLGLPRYARAFVPALPASAGILAAGVGAHFLGSPTKPLAQVALGAGLCVIAYALCVPAFLRMKEIA